jgi:hypothetical protein
MMTLCTLKILYLENFVGMQSILGLYQQWNNQIKSQNIVFRVEFSFKL